MALSLLIQFVFRLSFGMALAMGLTPSRLVSSGYYRVHLWVLLGLNTLAVLAVFSRPGHLESADNHAIWLVSLGTAAGAALLSYFGAIMWLYERARPGTVVLFIVSAVALAGAAVATDWSVFDSDLQKALAFGDLVTGGLLLGVTIAAMFLGHWYLNTPGMQLAPLQRLVLLMGVAVLLRCLVSGVGLALQWQHEPPGATWLLFVSLRWLSGIVGAAVLAVMTWQTLKVPNTQSATGILYVGVICTFLGELTSQLLSVETMYPV